MKMNDINQLRCQTENNTTQATTAGFREIFRGLKGFRYSDKREDQLFYAEGMRWLAEMGERLTKLAGDDEIVHKIIFDIYEHLEKYQVKGEPDYGLIEAYQREIGARGGQDDV